MVKEDKKEKPLVKYMRKPIESRIPNEETLQAMEELEANNGKDLHRVSSVDELIAELEDSHGKS